ncbi:MAG: GlsB/YeaQ/YmgE family stress response membrane protein [Actinomycetota bacterium]|nr:GlsB/YeaQ/YmgE family stress response membrane protein [Actinomycetota bacterium]
MWLFDLIGWFIGGLVIGALGRLAVPGRQSLGCLTTALVGIGGSIVGGLLGRLIFGRPGGWILAILCAAGIVFLLDRAQERAR